MGKTLALLHTTPVTVASLKELAARELPGVRVINVLDDSLLADVIAAGAVPDAVKARMDGYVQAAATAGADAVLCCCSSVGEVAERIEASIPVWRIDEAMADEAVRTGARIGVLATLPTTLLPTTRLVQRRAERAGRMCSVTPALAEGAFAALQAGRTAEHDALVIERLESLMRDSDVVVLAQASMARLVAGLGGAPRVPVLSSPESGLRRASTRLTDLSKGSDA